MSVGATVNRLPGHRIRVIIADDHPIFRQGLRRLLESEHDFLVIGEAKDGPEAVDLASRLRPDILLLDISMPGGSGFDALRELSTRALPVRAVVLTAEINREQLVQALQLGARGVLLKTSATDLLFKGLRAVMEGQHWVDRQTVTDLVQTLRELTKPTPLSTGQYGLTRRQLEIVACVVSGLANRDIARKLSISEDTVKHHLTQIFSKTGVSNRLELALFAMHHQLNGPV
jgi:two-component system, NarL family, nitrate/nitrite response regulator NarL